MLSGTIYSDGRNQFKDLVFSSREWSPPSMVSPDEIRKRVDSFALCGRTIARMKLIGLSYFHTRDWVEEDAYRQLRHLPEEERQHKSQYAQIASDMQFHRCANIDEPILIAFEDGDVFEIDTPQEPEFKMSMNSIPWEIKAAVNCANADANILFSTCIGKRIVHVEVNTYMAEKDPMYHHVFDTQPYRREFVSNITLRFENGEGLRIRPWIDYCEVACVNDRNECTTLCFSELKEALCNWEDLPSDESAE